jgi:large subunit ribosomal protein L10
MKRDEKNVVIADLQQKLEGASAFYLTDFTGLSVKQITQFRARLRKQGVEYVVVKNTLAKRAVEGLELPDVAGFFSGPTGLVIGREDAVAAAKVLSDFAREFGDRPAVKVGVVERKPFGPEQVKQLADMPPKEVLLAQIAGGLQAPMARLAGGMSQLMAGFVRAVDQLRQQKEGAAA